MNPIQRDASGTLYNCICSHCIRSVLMDCGQRSPSSYTCALRHCTGTGMHDWNSARGACEQRMGLQAEKLAVVEMSTCP